MRTLSAVAVAVELRDPVTTPSISRWLGKRPSSAIAASPSPRSPSFSVSTTIRPTRPCGGTDGESFGPEVFLRGVQSVPEPSQSMHRREDWDRQFPAAAAAEIDRFRRGIVEGSKPDRASSRAVSRPLAPWGGESAETRSRNCSRVRLLRRPAGRGLLPGMAVMTQLPERLRDLQAVVAPAARRFGCVVVQVLGALVAGCDCQRVGCSAAVISLLSPGSGSECDGAGGVGEDGVPVLEGGGWW